MTLIPFSFLARAMVVLSVLLLIITWSAVAFMMEPSALIPPVRSFPRKALNTQSYRRPFLQRPLLQRKQKPLLLRSMQESSAVSDVSSSSTSNYKVIYQKVIHPPRSRHPNNNNSGAFLGSLIEYLESHFTIPNDLPMIYDKTLSSNDSNNEHHAILSIDSPLSSHPDQTRMEVEVIGIYPDSENVMFPTMAMVAVKKSKRSSNDGLLMMQSLFTDSEHKILRALERGLTDFMEGSDSINGSVQKFNHAASEDNNNGKNRKGASAPNSKNDDYILHDTEVKVTRKETRGVIMDTTATPYAVNGLTEIKDCTTGINDGIIARGGNFAVEAAKAVAAKKKWGTDSGSDYIVEAAKVFASNLEESNSKTAGTTRKKKKTTKLQSMTLTPNDESKVLTSSSRNSTSGLQKFQDALPIAELNVSSNNKVFKSTSVSTTTGKRRDISLIDTVSSAAVPVGKKPPIKTNRKVNILDSMSAHADNVAVKDRQSTFENAASKPEEGARAHDTKISKTKTEIENDIMKAAMEVMPDMNGDGDMTPEELLQDVLKFGKQQQKEDTVGDGFASGALKKAKELMSKEQQLTINTANNCKQVETVYSEKASRILNPTFLNDFESNASRKNSVTCAEEELKRIFAAGQSIAEGRMTHSAPNHASVKSDFMTESKRGSVEISDQAIEALIDADRTVPRNARSIDDELAELEVRISRSPGERSYDAPDGPNLLFDVFSGPETFNHNVDPKTSVNWPGAPLGARNDVRHPPELAAAVKNAQFAANVLTNMREVDNDETTTKIFVGDKELNEKQVKDIRRCVDEAVAVGLIQDPLELLAEKCRLQMVLEELARQPEERFEEIAVNYKDLVLSDNFIPLIKERIQAMADRDRNAKRSGEDTPELEEMHLRERENLSRLTVFAQILLKEARAFGAELESAQLEVIRSICQVAMDPSHTTEEDTAMALTDAVRDMKPLLDENFVAYLKYAIAEEQAKLERSGVVDDPEHNRWLFVLKIVQEGVYTELARSVNRYIEHIWYVLRMETKSERRELLEKLIDVMPSMDVRPFVKVVDNIVGSLGMGVKGEFDTAVLGGMTNKLLQLRRDVQELLPPERITLMSKDADEWAARQRKRLLDQRKITRQRLKAAHDTAADYGLSGRGEIERMT